MPSMRRRLLPGETEPPSKGSLKRGALEIRSLAERLAAPGGARWDAPLELPENVTDALAMARRLPAGSARARQVGYVAKLLRKLDGEAIHRRMQELEDEHRLEARKHQRGAADGPHGKIEP